MVLFFSTNNMSLFVFYASFFGATIAIPWIMSPLYKAKCQLRGGELRLCVFVKISFRSCSVRSTFWCCIDDFFICRACHQQFQVGIPSHRFDKKSRRERSCKAPRPDVSTVVASVSRTWMSSSLSQLSELS